VIAKAFTQIKPTTRQNVQVSKINLLSYDKTPQTLADPIYAPCHRGSNLHSPVPPRSRRKHPAMTRVMEMRLVLHPFIIMAGLEQMSATRWFAKCALSATLLLIASGLASAWFGNRLQVPAVTTRDGTLVTLNRYANEPTPDIVLVGSSLTVRLKEEYFATPHVRNLGLAGGSPVTALEIVVNRQHLPKLVLVEANVLSRPPDAALVEKYSKNANAEPLFLRPVRAAVAAYENWHHAPLTHAQVDELLKQPPSDLFNGVYVDRALQQFNAEDPTAVAQANASRVEQLISSIEQRGSRALLFELPYSESIEGSRSANTTRQIVHAKFLAPDQWLHIEYSRDNLRWADGVHLDERSAVIVAQSIDRALSKLRPVV
jgi:hypothetical protein